MNDITNFPADLHENGDNITIDSAINKVVEIVSGYNNNVTGGKVISNVIDGKQVGNTVVFTGPVGKQCFLEYLAVVPTGITGFVSAPTISLGKTGANFSDIVSATALAGLSSTGFFTKLQPKASASIVNGGEQVSVRVSVAASATTYNFRVALIGRLI